MSRFEVTAYGANDVGLAFDRGPHMLDASWGRSFDDLGDALAFVRHRKSGWAYTDDSEWRRRAVKTLYLYELADDGRPWGRHTFQVTPSGQPNVDVRSTGVA